LPPKSKKATPHLINYKQHNESRDRVHVIDKNFLDDLRIPEVKQAGVGLSSIPSRAQQIVDKSRAQ